MFGKEARPLESLRFADGAWSLEGQCLANERSFLRVCAWRRSEAAWHALVLGDGARPLGLGLRLVKERARLAWVCASDKVDNLDLLFELGTDALAWACVLSRMNSFFFWWINGAKAHVFIQTLTS